MEYRFMGRTGLKVSALCLGAMTFGREADEPTSMKIMDRFYEVGGTFIDTADVYSRGISEEIVGRWMHTKPRDQLIIATKVRFTMGSGMNDVGLSRKHIMDAVHASLRRLETDYIDLYQVHCWDKWTPLEETLSTMHTLVEQGKVRYVGVSNYAAWQLQKAVDLAKMHGWEQFTCLQPLYNLLHRTLEWELVPVCLNEGLGIIPWSPLRGGWLSGKYKRGMAAPPPNTRVDQAEKEGWGERWSVLNNERTWSILDALFAVAEEAGKHPAQVAIRWLLQREGVTAPIIGARNMEQLESNLGSVGWELTAAQMERLNTVSEPELVYPYDFINGAQRKG
ncbi:MAG: aldo/keto reductase [Anaerolineae bacterium]